MNLQTLKAVKLKMVNADQRCDNRGTETRYGTAFSVVVLW